MTVEGISASRTKKLRTYPLLLALPPPVAKPSDASETTPGVAEFALEALSCSAALAAGRPDCFAGVLAGTFVCSFSSFSLFSFPFFVFPVSFFLLSSSSCYFPLFYTFFCCYCCYSSY